MLEFIMLSYIEAFDLLGASNFHGHFSVFFILIRILLLHLTDLRMLASFDLTLTHELIVVLLLCRLVLSTLFARLLRFVPFAVTSFRFLPDIASLLVEPTIVLLVLESVLLANLHDSNLVLIIPVS